MLRLQFVSVFLCPPQLCLRSQRTALLRGSRNVSKGSLDLCKLEPSAPPDLSPSWPRGSDSELPGYPTRNGRTLLLHLDLVPSLFPSINTQLHPNWPRLLLHRVTEPSSPVPVFPFATF